MFIEAFVQEIARALPWVTDPRAVASLFGYLGLGFSLVSMVVKSNETLLRINVFAALWWGLNGFFLGSLTSLVVQLIGAGLTAIRIWAPENLHLRATQAALALVCAACLATWQGWASLPVTAATLSLIVGVGLAKGIWVRVFFLVANTCFFMHALIYGADEQVMACLASYIAIAIGMVRMCAPVQASPIATHSRKTV